MDIDTGLSEKHRETVANALSHLLADSYTLYLKTHNYHWNVSGPLFRTLHLMFEEQYQELAVAADDIAERIRALGHHAPGTYRAFLDLTSIPEENTLPGPKEMVGNLVRGHEAVIRTARDTFAKADAANDQATADLAAQRIRAGEKTAWMLRELLK